jgi:hypothetical protein
VRLYIVAVTKWICQGALIGFLAISLTAAAQDRAGEPGASVSNVSNDNLSPSVKKLLRKPRLGSAELTWKDGRTEQGSILRVTGEFIAFETGRRPLACEDVGPSEIATVRWLPASRTQGAPGGFSYTVDLVFFGLLMGPWFVEDGVATLFQGISPPLKPPRGTWKTGKSPRGSPQSSLEFNGQDVTEQTILNGRWSVDRSQLHLVPAGAPEWTTSFQVRCGTELVLDHPFEQLQCVDCRYETPVVGDWRGKKHWLNLKPDGAFVEERLRVRRGAFTNVANSVKIHWTDSAGPGGGEWIGRIKHKHIVVRVDGVTREYHYEPPGLELDL